MNLVYLKQNSPHGGAGIRVSLLVKGIAGWSTFVGLSTVSSEVFASHPAALPPCDVAVVAELASFFGWGRSVVGAAVVCGPTVAVLPPTGPYMIAGISSGLNVIERESALSFGVTSIQAPPLSFDAFSSDDVSIEDQEQEKGKQSKWNKGKLATFTLNIVLCIHTATKTLVPKTCRI